MSEQDKTDSPTSQMPGIAIILFLLGFIWVTSEPFKTTRPPVVDSNNRSSENVRSRLWQDPFEAVAQHRKKYRSDDSSPSEPEKAFNNSNHDIAYQLKNKTTQTICNSSSMNPDGIEARALSDAHSFEELRCQIQRDVERRDVEPWDVDELSKCSLFIESVKTDLDRQEKLQSFKENLANKTECSLLAIHSKKDATFKNWEKNSIKNWEQSPFSWTFAGFNQAGEFREKTYDKPSSQFTQKLEAYLESLNSKISDDLQTKNALVAIIARFLKSPELHVIAVMVPGGPYAEDAERRLRDRYAVISGLANMGYMPGDPEHIGYIELTEKCIVAIKSNDANNTPFCDWPAFIPYEWFAPIQSIKNNSSIIQAPQKALVLWLDNESFIAPLSMLGKLQSLIKPGIEDNKFGKVEYIDIKFDVLGPSDSGTLERMYREAFKAESLQDFRDLEDSTIFSSQATKSSVTIIKNIGAYEQNGNIKWLDNKIQRMTSTNNELMSELVCELTRRGIQPFGKIDQELIAKQCKDAVFWPRWWPNQLTHHIALISEFDTVYSRDLTQTITTQIQNLGGGNPSENASTDNQEQRIHHFNYLRGLDGIDTNEKYPTENTKKQESDQKDIENKSELIRRPVGTNQFDYLRRIAERISQLDYDLVKENKGEIKAIGILGSDTYDKLLILQILRKQFPNMVFFTTDLDARLLHPAEIKWTRNLIVASSYDLTLSGDLQSLQMGAPPFRDSYQTGLYLSTLIAIGCWQENCQNVTILNNRKSFSIDKPQLFEIGHAGAVKLSNDSQTGAVKLSSNGSQDNNLLTFVERISFIIFPIVLAAFFYFQSNAKTKEWISNKIQKIHIAYVFLVLLVISILIVLGFFHGKTILFMLFNEEAFSLSNGTSVWPTNLILFFAALIAFILIKLSFFRLTKSNTEIIEEFNIQEPENKKIPWRGAFANFWEKEPKEGEKISFKEIWLRYRELGATPLWETRVLTVFLLYVLGMLLLVFMSAINLPDIPFRGQVSYKVSHFILYFTTALYLFLIFLVWDIVLLNNLFVRQLAKSAVCWPKDNFDAFCTLHQLPRNIAKEKFLFDFVIERTTVVGKLVFYPFFILFLMILSQSYYFDNWYIPLELGIIIGITAAFALGSAIRLSYTVKKIRNEILGRLERQYLESKGKWTLMQRINGLPAEIKLLIDEIKHVKTGPLAPLSRHPIVHSIVVPFTGIGGLYLIEYFASATG